MGFQTAGERHAKSLHQAELGREQARQSRRHPLQPPRRAFADELAHHSAEAVAGIETVSATAWFLPLYSPDLNPIEARWAKVKQAVRRQAARTFETRIGAISHPRRLPRLFPRLCLLPLRSLRALSRATRTVGESNLLLAGSIVDRF
jgi:transposase